MLLTHSIQIPIYDKTVTLIFGDAWETQEYLQSKYDIDSSFDVNFTKGITISCPIGIWIWFRTSDFCISTLVHELGHAVFDIMHFIGLDLSDQEAYCYLLDYLVTQCESIFAIQMDLTKLHLDKAVDQA